MGQIPILSPRKVIRILKKLGFEKGRYESKLSLGLKDEYDDYRDELIPAF